MIEPRPDWRLSLNGSTASELWFRFFREVFQALNGTTPPRVPVVTVASLPSVSPAGRLVVVSDETGGSVLAFTDGTNWRRSTDRAVVS